MSKQNNVALINNSSQFIQNHRTDYYETWWTAFSQVQRFTKNKK